MRRRTVGLNPVWLIKPMARSNRPMLANPGPVRANCQSNCKSAGHLVIYFSSIWESNSPLRISFFLVPHENLNRDGEDDGGGHRDEGSAGAGRRSPGPSRRFQFHVRVRSPEYVTRNPSPNPNVLCLLAYEFSLLMRLEPRSEGDRVDDRDGRLL